MKTLIDDRLLYNFKLWEGEVLYDLCFFKVSGPSTSDKLGAKENTDILNYLNSFLELIIL